MREGNTWGPVGFILTTALYTWGAFLYFQAKCFSQLRMPVSGYVMGYYESYQCLLLLVAVFTGMGTLLCLRKRRQTLHMAANVLLPLELYLLAIVADYNPVLVVLMGVALVAAFFFYAWLIFIASKGSVLRKSAWFMHGMKMLTALILLPGLLYVFGMDKGVVTAAQAEAAALEDVEEHTIKNHIEDLVIFEESRWQEASMEEKATALTIVAAIETRYLGLSRTPDVNVGCLKAGLLGRYVPGEGRVYVSADVVKYGSGEEALEVLLHEMYHAYQREQVDLYQNAPEKYRTLRLFNNAETYLEEFSDYKTGDEDFEAYKNQWVEESARIYANEGVLDYEEEIAAYLTYQKQEEKKHE